MTPDAIIQQSIDAITMHADIGLHRGTPSHLCWRTAQMDDYTALVRAARRLGVVVETHHNDRPLAWVKLATPLTQHKIEYLEITAPRTEDTATRPAMLVFHQPALAVPEKHPSWRSASFTLRFQAMHASALMAG